MADPRSTNAPYVWLLVAGVLILVLFGLQLKASLQKTSPTAPSLEVLVTDPARGELINPVLTVVEFGDFQCPFCGQQHEVLRQFMAEHGTQVKHVWKDFPLEELHLEAANAAEAARCAQLQNAFWPMHDWLFDHQTGLSPESYQQAANELGLNIDSFNSCLADDVTIDWVRQNFFEAETLGLRSTPALVINNQVFEDIVPLATLEQLLVAAGQ